MKRDAAPAADPRGADGHVLLFPVCKGSRGRFPGAQLLPAR